MPSSNIQQNPMQRAVCLSVEIGRFGTRRGVSTEEIEVTRDKNADKTLLHVGKEILESDLLEKIMHADTEFKNRLKRKSLPSPFRNGVYAVATDMIERVDQIVEDYLKERATRVERFIEEEYEQKKNEAKKRLGPLWSSTDYPTKDAVRDSFYVKTAYVSFSTPDSLKTISGEIYAREKKKARAEIDVWVDQVKLVLRSSFAKLVTHMSDKLTPTADGVRKTFRDTLVTNVTEFLDDFDARNIVKDQALADLVKKAKASLKGVSASMLRDDDKLREQIQVTFGGLENKLDKMMTDAPKRRLKFD